MVSAFQNLLIRYCINLTVEISKASSGCKDMMPRELKFLASVQFSWTKVISSKIEIIKHLEEKIVMNL